MARVSVLEAYNVEFSTRMTLAAGGDGQGTLLGNLLEDIAKALGGTITKWDPVKSGGTFHLRVHIVFP